MPEIRLTLTEDDFERLCEASAPWTAQVTDDDSDRYELVGGDLDHTLSFWDYAYWIGSNYAAVMLAAAFLEAEGHPYALVFDSAVPYDIREPQHVNGWLILTGFNAGMQPRRRGDAPDR